MLLHNGKGTIPDLLLRASRFSCPEADPDSATQLKGGFCGNCTLACEAKDGFPFFRAGIPWKGRCPFPGDCPRGLQGLSPRAPGAVRVPQGWPRAARWRCGVAFPRSGMAREWFGISGWIEPLRPLISRFLKCSCHSSSDRLPPFPEGHLSFTGPADVLPCVLIPQVLKRCNVV